jgi:hypothetical protein
VKPLSIGLLLVCAAAAQIPRIGDINLYGLRKVSAERVLAAAGARAGGHLPASKGDAEDAIEKIPGVVLARVEGICCEGDRAVLFIGIEERGAPHPSFRSPPAGNASLPPELVDTYDNFLAAVAHAAAEGRGTEDLTAGHSTMDDPEARAFQPRFQAFAAEHLDWLREVLRQGPEAAQRAIAAAVIGYAPEKAKVVDDLQLALQDPDDSVRANALRSLTAIVVYASKHPETGIHVSATWMVELLNSIVLNDRLEASKALVTLTDEPNPQAIALIRERALPALAEMARWKTLRYALPPFLLLGRTAGVPEAQIRQAWENGDRESVIGKALGQQQ